MSWKLSSLDNEHHTYDYLLQDFVCRLCWNNNGFVKLTSYSPKSIQNESTIAEKILESVGIDVSKHSHPNTICSSCLEEIEFFIEFKRFCQESDKKLLCILKNGSQKVTPGKVKLEIDYDPVYLKNETNLQIEISLDLKNEEKIDKVSLNQETDKVFTDFISDETTPSSGLVKDKNIYCCTCHMVFDSTEKLTQHDSERHRSIEDIECYKCYGCEKRFKDLSLRLNHEIRSCDALAHGYKCNFCDTHLRKRTLLETHIKEHKKKKDVAIDDILKCSECSDSFDSLRGLKRHMFTHKKKTTNETFVCEVCGRVCSNRGNLYNHRLIHTALKQLKCPHCDHTATQQSSLTAHIRTHTGDRPYACDQCPQRCTTSSNLVKHKKLKHLQVKKFKCNICEKKYRDKESLNDHISAVHEKLRKHTCNKCGVQYTRFRTLREHLLIKHGLKVRKVKNELIEIANGIVYKRKKCKVGVCLPNDTEDCPNVPDSIHR